MLLCSFANLLGTELEGQMLKSSFGGRFGYKSKSPKRHFNFLKPPELPLTAIQYKIPCNSILESKFPCTHNPHYTICINNLLTRLQSNKNSSHIHAFHTPFSFRPFPLPSSEWGSSNSFSSFVTNCWFPLPCPNE